jgi:hypothetical protein
MERPAGVDGDAMSSRQARIRRRKRRHPPLVKVTYATCTTFATFEMTCPLCQARVPAGVTHECRKANA